MIEMFVIMVAAIIVVGPKDFPIFIRKVGRLVSKVKSMGQDFQSGVKRMADEVELETITKEMNEAGHIPLEEENKILDPHAPDIIDEPNIIEKGEPEAPKTSSK